MQQNPDDSQVLAAVRAFLRDDLAPAIADRALRFRVLIAANLVGQIGAHLDAGVSLQAAEAAGLARLGIDAGDLAAGNAELARRIRAGSPESDDFAAALEHLITTQAAYLAATDPGFDTRREIE